jgi:uncharacterized membrane protein
MPKVSLPRFSRPCLLVLALIAQPWPAHAQEPADAPPVVPEVLTVPAPQPPPPPPPTPVIVNVPAPEAPPKPITGLWLTTDYPVLTERLGDQVTLDLRLANKNLLPRRVELSVEGLPRDWTYELDGGGKTVSAAFAGLDQTVALILKITPPKDAAQGMYSFTVVGDAGADRLELPISLMLAEPKPARVTLEPKLPALRGTARSTFDFQVTVRNDSADDQLFNLIAESPAGLDTVFTESYGSQELTSLPVKAGESKDLKVSVKLPQDTPAGQYPVTVEATSARSSADTELVVDVTGQPLLALSGPEGRLSGEATAGQERGFTFKLRNTGSAPARDIRLSATSPAGWKVRFDPGQFQTIAPAAELEVSALMTPAEKAIAGDYVVSVKAGGEGASANADFRVTVLTSTLWGIAGLGVIGVAVIVLAVAVTRYGRR